MPVPRPLTTTLRFAKRAVQGGFELAWSLGFATLGRLRTPRAELWSSPGGLDVLVVAPHPDDEVAGCGGTLLRHRRRGDRVVVACATDGRLSRAQGLEPEAMAAARRLEAEAAARGLGVELEWIGLPEGEWREESLVAALRELLERLSPDLVYAPSRVDFHPEHERTARALAAALAAVETSPVVRIYPVQVPLTPRLANLLSPVADVVDDLTAALGCYRSQIGSLLGCLRHRRYLGRQYRARGPAEELWQMSARQYRRLHQEPWPSASPFRGLRHYAWSDPLAYLAGRRERRRLGEPSPPAPLPEGEGSQSRVGPAPDWTLRAFRAGDEIPIAELFERAFGRRLDVADWRWKLEHPSEPVETAWVAVDRDDRPIFHYGGIPCRLHLPGGVRRAMVSVDAMTDPAYQRRGVLTACAPAVFEKWRAAGYALTLGLPNERYGSRTEAVGWRPLFPLEWRIRPLRLDRILARRLALPGLAILKPLSALWNLIWDLPGRGDPAIEIASVDEAGEEFDAFEDVRRRDAAITFVRGSHWIRWRYLSHPSRGYRVIAARRGGRLVGYLAYRTDDAGDDRVAYLAELVTFRADRAARKALLAAGLARSKAEGAMAVLSLAVPGSDLHRALRRAGFVLTRGSFLVHCVPFEADLDLDLLRDPRRWQLYGGDFDVI